MFSKYRKIEKGLISAKKGVKRALKEIFVDSLYFNLPKIFHVRRLVFFTFVILLIISISFIGAFVSLEKYHTYRVPESEGTYTEGIVGKINIFNPLYSDTNLAETEINSLVFSGLTKLNTRRQLVPDLAVNWQISEDNRIYTFYLRDNIKWHDGEKLTADDVIFTYKSIQNPKVLSPLFPVWQEVKIEKVSDLVVKFILPNPYAPFLTLTNVGIIPAHILDKIPPENLSVCEFNFHPIGTGPYKFLKIEDLEDSQKVTLEASPSFFPHDSYIEKVVFRIYPSYSELLDAYAKKDIMGIKEIFPTEYPKAEKLKNINLYETYLPQYVALFLSQKSSLISGKNIRLALAKSIDRQEIIRKVFSGRAREVYFPILPGFFGYDPKLEKYPLDIEEAKLILEKDGWILGEDGIRTKEETKLKFNLVTRDIDDFKKVAEIIKNQWQKIGVLLEIKAFKSPSLEEDHIRPRNYDVLLYGESLGADPDIYNYWHSTQISDPGLNLSQFENEKVDKYLEQARNNVDINFRKEKYIKIQKIIIDEIPAIFLYNPIYIYGVSKDVKGIQITKITEQKDRFAGIIDWYIKEKTISY